VVQAAIDAGATTINIPDTVGYAVPQEFGDCISYLFDHVNGLEKAVVHVHCHNDLGLAVANSLAAVKAGARGIECTINGIGERAGNCSLEEVVMALRTRKDSYGIETGIKTDELFRTSRLVTQMTGMHVQRNKAIVGANAFAHEAGIHQDGMLKERTTYEIMRPQDVGVSDTELVLGKHSGRHAFGDHMKTLGFNLTPKQLETAYEEFIALADRKKHIYDDDLIAIMQDQMNLDSAVFTLDYLHVSSGNKTVPTATVRLKKGNKILKDAACGDGPVDAAMKTIERITGERGKLLDFSLQAITKGKDALGEVSVQVRFGDKVVTGKGSSTDIVEAGAKAFLNCTNRYLTSKDRAKKAKAKPKAKAKSKTKTKAKAKA
jgi:2-isopropylmalate synthase